MASILENTKSQVKFYILERKTLPISKTNRAKLSDLKQKYENFSIEYIPVDPDDFSDMIPPVSGYITIDTYFRYVIPDVVPDLKKAIYLDADTIVQGDIAELYNLPLDDCYVGGVNHPKEYWDKFPLFYEIVSNLKLDNPYFYVNGGVMVFDCEKCRQDNIDNLLKEKTRQYKEKIKWADQDIMNWVLQGKLRSCLGGLILYSMHYASISIQKKKQRLFTTMVRKNHGIAICLQTICSGNTQIKRRLLMN